MSLPLKIIYLLLLKLTPQNKPLLQHSAKMANIHVLKKSIHYCRVFASVATLFPEKAFSTNNRSKICIIYVRQKKSSKNKKTARWPLKLLCYSYIIYHSGKQNYTADTLSRSHCAATNLNKLAEIQDSLSHPGRTYIWSILYKVIILIQWKT